MSDHIPMSSLAVYAPPEGRAGALYKTSDAEPVDFRKSLMDMLTARYTAPVDLENHPSQKPYATVEVGGKVVATLYNNGTMMCENRYAHMFKDIPANGQGPALAQQRADAIAALVGGTVVPAKTAITAQAYRQLPPLRFRLDEEALKADPMYQAVFNGGVAPQTLRAVVEFQETVGG